VPGVREEIYGSAEYHSVPVEKPFGIDREDLWLLALRVDTSAAEGLKHNFYALTAHFGKWETADGKMPVWVLLGAFVYGQMIKHQRRRRTVEVDRRIVWGEEQQYQERLKKVRFSKI